jgi:hypothetical protein
MLVYCSLKRIKRVFILLRYVTVVEGKLRYTVALLGHVKIKSELVRYWKYNFLANLDEKKDVMIAASELQVMLMENMPYHGFIPVPSHRSTQ